MASLSTSPSFSRLPRKSFSRWCSLNLDLSILGSYRSILPKLGPIEWLFVTPSNHRVHHARNKIYVDRNYGGVFILWDRIFGSFQEELKKEPAVFGLRKPLNSWNPIWANVHVYWRLILDIVSMPGIANKLKLLFKPPGWRAEHKQGHCKLGIEPVDLTSRFDPAISSFSLVYTCVQFLFTVVLSLAVLLALHRLVIR